MKNLVNNETVATKFNFKETAPNRHYWNHEGAYDKEFFELTDELMPIRGRGENLRAEVVRAANRLYYEYCNNGNCNAAEPVYSDGFGEYEEYDEPEEYEISEYYNNFIKLIRETLTQKDDAWGIDKIEKVYRVMSEVGRVILSRDNSEEGWSWYDRMIDLVYEWCYLHSNVKKPIPTWYNND